MEKMKKIVLLALTLIAASCAGSQLKEAVEEPLRTGDLIFVGIPADYHSDGMADAIVDATGNDGDSIRLIHVAIAEIDTLGQPWVIDATLAYGVDRHPLDTLFSQFRLEGERQATFILKRLDRPQDELEAFVEKAKSFCGEAYDQSFRPDNGRHYCTELVRDSYRPADGSYLFSEYPMNWKDADGEFPAYWVWLFDMLGEPIPQDEPGTNPQQMSAEPILRDAGFLVPVMQD